MKTINTKWKAATGIILTMILTLMLLTTIYWLFIEQQIETRSHRVLVMTGMIYADYRKSRCDDGETKDFAGRTC